MPTGTSTSQIDPFTPAGAQAISAIAGQQPAPQPASVLSAPTMPTLPQPTPSPIPAAPAVPTLNSIFDTAPTDLDTKFATASENEGNLEGEAANQTTDQDQAEQNAGIPGLKATVSDLTSRLNSLKTAADAIPLQIQSAFAGRGTTAAGLQPIQDAQTRENTIQQLGVSAMLNAANGNLSTAQDQVDAAIKAKYDPINAQIAAQKAQLDALTPLMDAEEKQQAAKQQAQLQDRQDQITKEQDDQKTIYQTMLAAAQNGADSITLRNIQNATDPNAAITAAGNFLNSPKTQAVNVDGRVKLINSQTGQTIADLGESDAARSLAAANANSPAQVAPYLQTTASGIQYADLSALSAGEKAKLAPIATTNGIKVITNPNEAVDLKNIQNAYNNLDTMRQTFSTLTSPSAASRLFNNIGVNPAATYFQTDPQKNAAGTLNDAAQDLLKSISGVQGARFSTAMIDQVKENLPTIYDTTDTANAKLDTITTLIANREGALLNTSPANAGPANNAVPSDVQSLAQKQGVSQSDLQQTISQYGVDQVRQFLSQ